MLYTENLKMLHENQGPTNRTFFLGALNSIARSALLAFRYSWFRELTIAITLALLIIAFLFQPVKVEGTSMSPSLRDQERLLINKFVYHFEPIARGDIVVFRYPHDPSKSFIKRIIGLPGETIEIRAGKVYVNKTELLESYVAGERWEIGSVSPVIVPPGQYYVLGDHRTNSNDSRTWGPVPRRYVYGKAAFVYWPIEQTRSLAEGIRE